MVSYECLKEHNKVIDLYKIKMKKANYPKVLSDIYNYVKSITDMYYDEYGIHYNYTFIRENIIYAEDKYPTIKILNIPIIFDKDDLKDDFIEYIVHSTRKYLVNEHTAGLDYNRNINSINFTNDCKKAAKYIKKLCDEYNIESYLLPIHPGYEERANLYEGSGFHFANVIKYNNKYYLVDVTYSQFFYQRRNNLDRIGLMYMSGCNAGTFMLMTDKGKTIATKILQDGYIELNDEILKTYLDSFTISFRNGLYYEKTNDFSYTTSYSIDDYINFLKGNDNQINHEGRENLGYQKRPLKNCNLKFKK